MTRTAKTLAPLPAAYFVRPTLEVARDLLGKLLVHDEPEAGRLIGRIVETEGYTADDPAMHGWKAQFGPDGRVMPVGRAAALFGPPGTAYVYLIYYTSWLLNVVTEPEGTAGAVLIRAVEPVEGEAAMAERRPAIRRAADLTNGPGKLAQAFGVDGRHHGSDLTKPPLFFADDGAPPPGVATSSRIGLTRGIDRPNRFYVPRHPYVSPGPPSDLRVARRTKRSR
ncbi:MAG TPA: DNA-3-methyladenine glycosylase [Rubricoccaceae bacterium]|nr:DNA-3-methyladenine glycosylase [Rubricoccaceae bacterium]